MSLSIREALSTVCRTLDSGGVSTPRLEAELMVRQATGLGPLDLLLQPFRLLDKPEMSRLEAYVERRLKREPLAYVFGVTEFYGLEFQIDIRALIPRPETELLVEKAVEVADGLVGKGHQNPVLVDVGTGSGCVAVILAVMLPHARTYAIDMSPAALELARANCSRHRVDGRVTLLQGDLLGPLPEPPHIIVANLPYVASEALSSLAPELSFEPRAALDGGRDGTDCIRRLLEQATGNMFCHSTILLEIGQGQSSQVADLAERAFPDSRVAVHKDLASIDRVVQINREAAIRSEASPSSLSGRRV